MWLFLASDAMGFIGLISAYIVLRWSNPAATWIPGAGDWSVAGQGSTAGLPPLDPVITGVNTFILIVSSFTMVLALDACHRGLQKRLLTFLGLTAGLGAVFLGVQVYEYSQLLSHGLAMWHHPYGATFYMCTGFHGAHVLSGVIYLVVMWLNALKGKYGPHNSSPVELVGLFWHFVDLVWIILFTIIYLF
jgi:heme/copper-type cytochrome/quinol oxidase subunit 3